MVQVLHAWVCGTYAGRFERSGADGSVSFVHDSGSDQGVSLSLPRDGAVAPDAAGSYLAGLIPENRAAREVIQKVTGAKSDSAWDLLEAIGGDLPGGLVLQVDEADPSDTLPYVWEAYEGDIADRIAQIHRGGSGFSQDGPPPRFSVAGAQSKFTIARREFGTFWPDASTVSSHIIKPEAAEHRGLERIEAATLRLANLSGISAPHAEQVSFGDLTAFEIERFDRVTAADGSLWRIHSEDMTQILGVGPNQKYLVEADEVAVALRGASGSDELGYAFYQQLIFNTMIGNSDAHGKNYSILYRGGEIEISPLYDSFPMGFFPAYGQDLSMPIGSENRFNHVTPNDWKESAEESGLDPDRVLADVQSIGSAVAENLDEALGSEDAAVLDRVREAIDRNTGLLPPEHLKKRTIDLSSAQSRRSPGTQDRRGDQGLGKTAGGGNAGSFAQKRRTEADGSVLGDPPSRPAQN